MQLRIFLQLLWWGEGVWHQGTLLSWISRGKPGRDGKHFMQSVCVYRFALKYLCMFAATALYNMSSVLKQPLKFHRNRWHVVSEYSKTFPIKKSWWEMKGTPNVEPSNSRWWLKIPFPFFAVYLQGMFPMYLGEREREIWQTFPLFYTSLLQILFSFLQDGSKHAVPVKQACSTFVGT